MAVTTIGKLRLNKIMPEGFKNVERPLNSKELGKVMTDMAKSVPREVYVNTLKELTNFGFEVANDYGGVASAHLKDVTLPPQLKEMRNTLRRHVYQISQREDLDPKTKNKKIIESVRKATPIIDKAIVEVLKDSDNSFGLMVGSGVKGKPAQLRALVFGDLLTVDSKMRDIPYPTFRSYGEGITPLQYWTASHGGRYGYIQVQKATADAGYFSKQTRGVVHRQIITMNDCGRAKPYYVDSDDDNAVGSLLFKNTKGKSGKVYEADTIITDDILDDLEGKIATRSAVCCGAGDGVCSHCAGVRESGRLPDIGDAVGLNGINAGNEQITQMGLCLHGDTQVRMANGSNKAIKDITAGEMVMAADRSGKQYPAPVIANHYNGKREVYTYTFKVGGRNDYRTVIATRDHKILKYVYHSNCKDRDILNNTPSIGPIGDTDNKQFALLSGAEQAEPEHRIYDKRALLLGLLLGDGGYTRRVKHVHFSCADDRLMADIKEYLQDLNLRLSATGTKYWYRVSSIEDHVHRDEKSGRFDQSGARNPAKKMLEEFNIYDKYAHEKSIPDVCYTWNNKAIAELLAGLWATDGSIYHSKDSSAPFAALGSTSKKLLEQVKYLLEVRFGIYSTPISGSNSGNRKRTLFKLSINQMSDVYRFLQILSVPGVKREHQESALAVLENMVSCRTPFYLADKAAKKSEQYYGLEDTYDLELNTPEHLFVLANGLVVSNSSKHGGGESTGAKRIKRGFAAVDQFINMPENFVGGASVASVDGRINKIEDAPQGGKNVFIGETVVYVPTGFEPTVKIGQHVESGDIISEGMPNIETITKYKGLGAGRKAFVESLYDIMAGAGSAVPKKQIEPFARAYVDRVEITDPDGLQGWIYGDVASYNVLEKNWKPRVGSFKTTPEHAVGKYLEIPEMHYTIGTRITPSVIKDMQEAGIKELTVNSKEAPFIPHMTSAKQFAMEDPDWITALSGEGLTKSFLNHVQRTSVSRKGTTSYYPDLALIGVGDTPALKL